MDMQALANELAKELGERGAKLYPRPYRRYSPQESEWWLKPTTENPGYRYGKIALLPVDGRLLVGLCVEKGFGATVAQVEPAVVSRGWLVDRSWLWYTALSDICQGRLATAAQEVRFRSGLATVALVRTYRLVTGDTPGTVAVSPPLAELRWVLDNGSLAQMELRPETELSNHLHATSSLAVLADRLKTIPDADWLWFDVYMGVIMDMPLETPDGPSWDVGHVATPVSSHGCPRCARETGAGPQRGAASGAASRGCDWPSGQAVDVASISSRHSPQSLPDRPASAA